MRPSPIPSTPLLLRAEAVLLAVMAALLALAALGPAFAQPAEFHAFADQRRWLGLEQADHDLFALDNGWLSGHSLKHIVASLAAWPVFAAMCFSVRASIGAPADSRQNPAGTEARHSARRALLENN